MTTDRLLTTPCGDGAPHTLALTDPCTLVPHTLSLCLPAPCTHMDHDRGGMGSALCPEPWGLGTPPSRQGEVRRPLGTKPVTRPSGLGWNSGRPLPHRQAQCRLTSWPTRCRLPRLARLVCTGSPDPSVVTPRGCPAPPHVQGWSSLPLGVASSRRERLRHRQKPPHFLAQPWRCPFYWGPSPIDAGASWGSRSPALAPQPHDPGLWGQTSCSHPQMPRAPGVCLCGSLRLHFRVPAAPLGSQGALGKTRAEGLGRPSALWALPRGF